MVFAKRVANRTLTSDAIAVASGEIAPDASICAIKEPLEVSSVLRNVMDWEPTDVSAVPVANEAPVAEQGESGDNPLVEAVDPTLYIENPELGIPLDHLPLSKSGVPLDEEDWVDPRAITIAAAPDDSEDTPDDPTAVDGSVSEITHQIDSVSSGCDTVLLNSLLLMRDELIHIEMCSAVREGDIGRVFEMIKVGLLASNSGEPALTYLCSTAGTLRVSSSRCNQLHGRNS